MAQDPFVVVGGGLAGAKAAETLRAEGFDGPVLLLAEESELPYERPLLSKDYLLGRAPREKAQLHDAGWYARQEVELRTWTRATALDVAGHRVALADGSELRYGALLLATGASPRRLPVPGADLDGVRYLRTAAEADRLLADLSGGGRRVVVIGAGWIGLEVAAAARHHGNDVVVVEPQPTPLHAVLGPRMGAVFAALHRENGVDLLTGTTVRELRGRDGRVASVVTDGHAGIPADLVVVGVGVVPDTQLAASAGLEVDDGIVVSEGLRAAVPDVYAAGDVARAYHPLYGRHVRVEHWANALNQGPAAARSMLGQPVSYERVPYAFTDQYDLGMEYSGLAAPADTVVLRGDVDGREFIAFWMSEGRVVAGMNVNVWGVAEPIQQLIRARRQVPAASLTDPGIPLERLAE